MSAAMRASDCTASGNAPWAPRSVRVIVFIHVFFQGFHIFHSSDFLRFAAFQIFFSANVLCFSGQLLRRGCSPRVFHPFRRFFTRTLAPGSAVPADPNLRISLQCALRTAGLVSGIALFVFQGSRLLRYPFFFTHLHVPTFVSILPFSSRLFFLVKVAFARKS